MQKNMWLMAALLFSVFISGCGGGSTTSVIASTTTALTSADVANKTLYSTSTKGYIAFQIYSGSTGGSAAWDSTQNRYSTPPADVSGTWGLSNGQLVLTSTNLTPPQIITFTCLQKEPNYWLVSDGSNHITRFYFDRTSAETYLNSITTSKGIKMGGAILPSASSFSNFTTVTNVSTVAGTTGTTGFNGFSDYTTANSPAVLFGRPVGITTMDGTTFFVLDNLNNDIRMLTPKAGLNGSTAVSTLKDSSGAAITFSTPGDITSDGTSLYVTDTYNCVIKKIYHDPNSTSPDVWVSVTLSGTGVSGAYDGTGNTLSTAGAIVTTGTARFARPIGITTDGTNLYVTDDQAIRKVDIFSGNVTTLAGTAGTVGWADATGTSARFDQPLRITTDGTNLYVSDCSNYVIRRVVIATGAVTTIAGSGGNSGTSDDSLNDKGITARFSGPNGITTDGTFLYVTDWGPVISGNPATGQTIRRVEIKTGNVRTIAGTANVIGSDSSHFDGPIGITTNGTSLYVADTLNYIIRKLN